MRVGARIHFLCFVFVDCFSPKGLRNDGEKALSLREVGTTSWQSTFTLESAFGLWITKEAAASPCFASASLPRNDGGLALLYGGDFIIA